MTLPEPSVPTVTPTPVGTEIIRSVSCPFCGGSLRVYFEWDFDDELVVGTVRHDCPWKPAVEEAA